MNDEWQTLLKDYVRENAIQSERIAKTLDFFLAYYFFRNEPEGYIQGFKPIAHTPFPERTYFISLAIEEYFDYLIEYISLFFEDGLDDLVPDRDTVLAYLDLYVSWAMEAPEAAKGKITAQQYQQWKEAYYTWFSNVSGKIPKKYRTITKINMEELFEEFGFYAV